MNQAMNASATICHQSMVDGQCRMQIRMQTPVHARSRVCILNLDLAFVVSAHEHGDGKVIEGVGRTNGTCLRLNRHASIRHHVVQPARVVTRRRQQQRVAPHALADRCRIDLWCHRRDQSRHGDNHAPVAGRAGEGEDVVTLRSLHVNGIVVAAGEDVALVAPCAQQHGRRKQLEAIVACIEDAGRHRGASVARALLVQRGQQPAAPAIVDGPPVVRVDER